MKLLYHVWIRVPLIVPLNNASILRYSDSTKKAQKNWEKSLDFGSLKQKTEIELIQFLKLQKDRELAQESRLEV